MNSEKILDEFKTELRTVRGLAENSVAIYSQEALSFLKFMAEHSYDIETCTRNSLLKWRESLNGRAHAGQALAVTAVRNLFDFLKMSDRLPEFKVKIKRQESANVPTVAQFLRMRKRLQEPITDPRAIRSIQRIAVVETLAGSALRIGALTSLQVKHLHLEGIKPFIMIVAEEVGCKGNSAGAVPISPYAASALRRYVQSYSLLKDDLVFDLSESVIRKIIVQASPEGMPLSPHSLRHFACSCLYYKNHDGGRNDVVYVRDAAGHASISTTDVYLKMARRVIQTDAEWDAWATGKEMIDGQKPATLQVLREDMQAAG